MSMNESKNILTVSQLTEYLRLKIESDALLSGVYVTGEISNFTRHRSGHLYFTVKDESSSISAVMFRSAAAKLRFEPEDGMKIIICGRVSFYPAQGKCQLYVDSLTPDGLGSLAMQYEQLKNRLGAAGLFDASHKKPLPAYPKVIGVVTSPTGAVIRDIINVVTRRFPSTKILLYPALVQGEEAPQALIDGINFFDASKCADVVIIGRGGGSMEDLWAFNNEALAYAIYSASIPVISAVGHETDFTICDFVADLRAPTPSAAAELAVPDREELLARLENYKKRMYTSLVNNFQIKRERLKKLSESYVLTNPARMFELRKLFVDTLSDRLDRNIADKLTKCKNILEREASKLEALSPLAVLSRGYSAVFNKENSLVRSVDEVKLGDTLSISLCDGDIDASVISIKKSNDKQKNNRKRDN